MLESYWRFIVGNLSLKLQNKLSIFNYFLFIPKDSKNIFLSNC